MDCYRNNFVIGIRQAEIWLRWARLHHVFNSDGEKRCAAQGLGILANSGMGGRYLASKLRAIILRRCNSDQAITWLQGEINDAKKRHPFPEQR